MQERDFRISRNKLKLVTTFLVVLPLIPIFIYLLNFFDTSLSDNPSDWGTFGDFFGGILNSYFSLLTLLITIYIAYEISNLEEKRNERNLSFERRKLLTELRESEFRRIGSELRKLGDLGEESGRGKILQNVYSQVQFYGFINKHLFPFLSEPVFTSLEGSIGWYSIYYNENRDLSGKGVAFLSLNCLKHILEFSEKTQQYILSEMDNTN
ncbi:hypothetical protein AAE02nite_05800 [Adhaeribacter aerolatus]|uniref:Uncharacterized protein n=1 Tax=Adhaeribacter aerolatus TaxID=670289 RepID=A0A512AT88_9BACT|nr:hypothetical protein [Adhaeribacter aerolatus]GEO02916.1 hypothetical protein AAE02nite_05800 [Adhaeribacter aerolatus]